MFGFVFELLFRRIVGMHSIKSHYETFSLLSVFTNQLCKHVNIARGGITVSFTGVLCSMIAST